MSDTNAKVRDVLVQLLGVDLSELAVNARQDQVERWDSLGHMNLMLALEEEFSIRFTNDEIATLKSIETIADSIDKKCRSND